MGQIIVTFKRVCRECRLEVETGRSTHTSPGQGIKHNSRYGIDTRDVACRQCGQTMKLFVDVSATDEDVPPPPEDGLLPEFIHRSKPTGC